MSIDITTDLADNIESQNSATTPPTPPIGETGPTPPGPTGLVTHFFFSRSLFASLSKPIGQSLRVRCRFVRVSFHGQSDEHVSQLLVSNGSFLGRAGNRPYGETYPEQLTSFSNRKKDEEAPKSYNSCKLGLDGCRGTH